MPAAIVTLTLNLSEVVTIVGGTPTLTLNDGGTAPMWVAPVPAR